MEQFFSDLKAALGANNGQLEASQVTPLLQPSARHRLAQALQAARDAGICTIHNIKVDGIRQVVVRSKTGGSS